MPIYEYRCADCGHHFEVIQRVQDRPPRKCAECGGKVAKQHSRTAFVLKGGGWYAHGYSKSEGGTKSEGSKTDTPATKETTKKPTKGDSA